MIMKRLIVTLALLAVTALAFAQKSPLLKTWVEIAQVEENDNIVLEVFYIYDDVPRQYYLCLGSLGVGNELIQFGVDPVDLLFLPLGGNLDEVILSLQEIKELYKMPKGESTQVDGYFSLLAPSGDLIPITVTSRRLIFSKLLEFSIPDSTQDLVRATYVDKCNFNSLLGSVKFYKKLHPTE